jgi:hypothetical protein
MPSSPSPDPDPLPFNPIRWRLAGVRGAEAPTETATPSTTARLLAAALGLPVSFTVSNTQTELQSERLGNAAVVHFAGGKGEGGPPVAAAPTTSASSSSSPDAVTLSIPNPAFGHPPRLRDGDEGRHFGACAQALQELADAKAALGTSAAASWRHRAALRRARRAVLDMQRALQGEGRLLSSVRGEAGESLLHLACLFSQYDHALWLLRCEPMLLATVYEGSKYRGEGSVHIMAAQGAAADLRAFAKFALFPDREMLHTQSGGPGGGRDKGVPGGDADAADADEQQRVMRDRAWEILHAASTSSSSSSSPLPPTPDWCRGWLRSAWTRLVNACATGTFFSAPPVGTCYYGGTALSIAAVLGHAEIIRFLLVEVGCTDPRAWEDAHAAALAITGKGTGRGRGVGRTAGGTRGGGGAEDGPPSTRRVASSGATVTDDDKAASAGSGESTPLPATTPVPPDPPSPTPLARVQSFLASAAPAAPPRTRIGLFPEDLPAAELLLGWDPSVCARLDGADDRCNTPAHMVVRHYGNSRVFSLLADFYDKGYGRWDSAERYARPSAVFARAVKACSTGGEINRRCRAVEKAVVRGGGGSGSPRAASALSLRPYTAENAPPPPPYAVPSPVLPSLVEIKQVTAGPPAVFSTEQRARPGDEGPSLVGRWSPPGAAAAAGSSLGSAGPAAWAEMHTKVAVEALNFLRALAACGADEHHGPGSVARFLRPAEDAAAAGSAASAASAASVRAAIDSLVEAVHEAAALDAEARREAEEEATALGQEDVPDDRGAVGEAGSGGDGGGGKRGGGPLTMSDLTLEYMRREVRAAEVYLSAYERALEEEAAWEAATGARPRLTDLLDGEHLTPITLAARLGKAELFEELWDRSVRKQWTWGGVEARCLLLDQIDDIGQLADDHPAIFEAVLTADSRRDELVKKGAKPTSRVRGCFTRLYGEAVCCGPRRRFIHPDRTARRGGGNDDDDDGRGGRQRQQSRLAVLLAFVLACVDLLARLVRFLLGLPPFSEATTSRPPRQPTALEEVVRGSHWRMFEQRDTKQAARPGSGSGDRKGGGTASSAAAGAGLDFGLDFVEGDDDDRDEEDSEGADDLDGGDGGGPGSGAGGGDPADLGIGHSEHPRVLVQLAARKWSRVYSVLFYRLMLQRGVRALVTWATIIARASVSDSDRPALQCEAPGLACAATRVLVPIITALAWVSLLGQLVRIEARLGLCCCRSRRAASGGRTGGDGGGGVYSRSASLWLAGYGGSFGAYYLSTLLLSLAFLAVGGVVDIALGWNSSHLLLALGGFFAGAHMLYFLLGFGRTGPLFVMLGGVLAAQFGRWLLLFIPTISVFSFVFYVVDARDIFLGADRGGNGASGFASFFGTYLLGAFDTSIQPTSTADVLTVKHGGTSAEPNAARGMYFAFFLVMLFLTSIGLLALLTAVLTHAFEEHMSKPRSRWLIERARACMLLDSALSPWERLSLPLHARYFLWLRGASRPSTTATGSDADIVVPVASLVDLCPAVALEAACGPAASRAAVRNAGTLHGPAQAVASEAAGGPAASRGPARNAGALHGPARPFFLCQENDRHSRRGVQASYMLKTGLMPKYVLLASQQGEDDEEEEGEEGEEGRRRGRRGEAVPASPGGLPRSASKSRLVTYYKVHARRFPSRSGSALSGGGGDGGTPTAHGPLSPSHNVSSSSSASSSSLVDTIKVLKNIQSALHILAPGADEGVVSRATSSGSLGGWGPGTPTSGRAAADPRRPQAAAQGPRGVLGNAKSVRTLFAGK